VSLLRRRLMGGVITTGRAVAEGHAAARVAALGHAEAA
jgi:hypothetical protein